MKFEQMNTGVHLSAEEEALYQRAIINNAGLSRAEFKEKRDDAVSIASTKTPELMNVGGHMLPVDDIEGRKSLEENYRIN